MMEETTGIELSLTKLNLKSKIDAVECTLNQTIRNFKDLVSECDRMQMESDSFRSQVVAQKEKCERKCCSGSEELKKIIQSKDDIIQLVASAITKLNETKNFGIIQEVFGILFGDTKSEFKIESKESLCKNIDMQKIDPTSSKVEAVCDMSVCDESVSEIESTPTGRQSPIIQSKITKNSTIRNADKKKCPDNWLTPDKKALKLIYPTPTKGTGSGRLRQQRLQLVKEKKPNLVDLTTLPQFYDRGSYEDSLVKNIKQEAIENDDTILPSPTSGHMFSPMFKSITKESPQKFKKPLSLKRKESRVEKENEENKPLQDATNVPELEESVNLLEQYQNGLSPKKHNEEKSLIQADESISLLQHINILATNNMNQQFCSPTKRPLAENMNTDNIDSSMSILPRNVIVSRNVPCSDIYENRNKPKPDVLEPLYKEPTVRKKAEKRALPGWSCDECQNFYAELYKDNPVMLAKKMEDCSKHRGKNNPVRPKTPPGYWNPRWDVPDDTEEFNRRNNAV